MSLTKTELQYNLYQKKDGAIPVIIVAAGRSSRMQGINKQFMSIMGVPVIARTLMAFESCADISKIILVTAGDSIKQMQLLCEKYMISKLSDIVEGGQTRHQSVMRGINRLDSNENTVLIHDGARPFVEKTTISEVVAALRQFDAALCVSKINDTVKKVSQDGIVLSTVDRSLLYAAQTPQGVNITKYKAACNALADVENMTDDASIMEAAGYSVKAVIESSRNIKITTPDDISIAEALVKGENEV